MIKPLFTEKSLAHAAQGRFTFRVSRELSKFQIRALIEEIFPVKVTDVATMNYKAETRRTMRGARVSAPSWKKAIVSLKEGQTISVFTQEKKASKKGVKKTTKK